MFEYLWTIEELPMSPTYGPSETQSQYPKDPVLNAIDSAVASLSKVREQVAHTCDHHFVPVDRAVIPHTAIAHVFSAGRLDNGMPRKSSVRFNLRCTKCDALWNHISISERCPACAGEMKRKTEGILSKEEYFPHGDYTLYALEVYSCSCCGLTAAGTFWDK